MGLDQTIVASAIPKISSECDFPLLCRVRTRDARRLTSPVTDDFNALNQVGWYGSAYVSFDLSRDP